MWEYSWLGATAANRNTAKHALSMASLCLAKQIWPYHDYSLSPGITAIQSATRALQMLRRLVQECDVAAKRAVAQERCAARETID